MSNEVLTFTVDKKAIREGLADGTLREKWQRVLGANEILARVQESSEMYFPYREAERLVGAWYKREALSAFCKSEREAQEATGITQGFAASFLQEEICSFLWDYISECSDWSSVRGCIDWEIISPWYDGYEMNTIEKVVAMIEREICGCAYWSHSDETNDEIRFECAF